MADPRAALFAVCLLPALLLATPSALARHADCDRAAAAPGMGEYAYRILERAVAELGDGQAAAAVTRLEALAGRVRDHERAVTLQTLGYAYLDQQRNDDALRVFAEALALAALPIQPQQQLMYNTAQLRIAAGAADGVALLERYLDEACEPPPAEAHMLFASVLAERGDYRRALAQTDLALGKLREPRESWLNFKLGLHYQLDEWREVGEVLVRLIALVPAKPQYWQQLSGVFIELRREREALAALAIAERQGLFDKASDYRNLSDIYRMLEIPYKAGRVYAAAMARGIVPQDAETLEYLADNWVLAREWPRAEAAMLAAAEQGDGGRHWQRLGQVYMEQARWQEALAALERASEAGTDDRHATDYYLGIAAYNAGEPVRAERALRVAARGGRHRESARQWLAHLQGEAAASP